LGSSGWAKATDETIAQGILMVDSVAAPTDDSASEGQPDVASGGIVGMPSKIYVGANGPVDTGPCVCWVPGALGPAGVVDDFAVGERVYVGTGVLYDEAKNSGAAIGTVLEIEDDRVLVNFKFVA